jgi:hypothetical protein
MIQKIIFLMVVVAVGLTFTGCGLDTNNTDEDLKTLYYDYYEIADDTVVYTKINEDPSNVVYLENSYLLSNNDYLVMHEEYFENYNLVNVPLDKNETLTGWKVDYLNTFTNKSLSSFTVPNYGLYMLTTNFCTINSSLPNCKTVIHTRYE